MRHMKIITFFGRLPSDNLGQDQIANESHGDMYHTSSDNLVSAPAPPTRSCPYNDLQHKRHCKKGIIFHQTSQAQGVNRQLSSHFYQHLQHKTHSTTFIIFHQKYGARRQLAKPITRLLQCVGNLVELLAPARPTTFSSYACWLLRTLDSVVPMSRVSELPWTLDTSAPMRPLSHCRKVASILHDMLGKCPK